MTVTGKEPIALQREYHARTAERYDGMSRFRTTVIPSAHNDPRAAIHPLRWSSQGLPCGGFKRPLPPPAIDR